MKTLNADPSLSAPRELATEGSQQAKYTPPAEELSAPYSSMELLAAGFEKYNVVTSMVSYGSRALGVTGNFEDVPDYDPYEDPENLAGYPTDLLSGSLSPQEDAWRKKTYDHDAYINHILDRNPVGGTVTSMMGGATNPLYLIPVMGWGGAASSAASRMIRGGVNAMGGEVATEALYHGMFDKTRTFDESVLNVGTAGLFGSVFGRFIPAKMTKAEKEHLTKVLKEDVRSLDGLFMEDEIFRKEINELQRGGHIPEAGKPYTIPEGEIVGPPAPPKEAEKIKTSTGTRKLTKAERALAWLTPARVLGSESQAARDVAANIAEQGVVGTTAPAVETLVKLWDGAVVNSIKSSRKHFREHAATGNKQTYESFQEDVVNALRTDKLDGDAPHVKAARDIKAKLLDKMTKRAQDAGLLPKDLKKVFGEGYFPRVPNIPKIMAESEEMVQAISRHFQEAHGVTAEMAEEAARGAVHNYKGKNLHDPLAAGAGEVTGHLKERTVNVPDSVLAPWMQNDIEHVLSSYTRNVAAQIEMVDRFGDVHMTKQLEEIRLDYDKLTKAAAGDKKAVAKLNKQLDKDIRLVQALRDRLLGRYQLPDDPSSFFTRAGVVARDLNLLRMLGGMTLSSMPDLARPIYNHGMAKYAGTIAKIAANPEFAKIAKADLHRMAIGVDMVLDNRIRSMSELEWSPYMSSRLETALHKLAHGDGKNVVGFGKIALMSQWNSSMKSFSGLMAQDGFLHKLNFPSKYVDDWGRAGISGEMVGRIKKEWKTHGQEVDGLRIAQSDKWSDPLAAQVFEAAILKEVEMTIVTPGILDRPLWMSTGAGKVIGQFKSFGFASTNRVAMAGLSKGDAKVLQGIIAQIALGALVVGIKASIAGKDIGEMTNEEWLAGAIDYSGITGMGSTMADMAMKGTQSVGLSEGTISPRFAGQSLFQSMLGPTAGLYDNMLGAGRAAFAENPAKGDVRSARALIPYNNLFYIRNLFDKMETEAAASLGVDR